MDEYLIGAGALLTAGPSATIRGATLHAQPGFELAGSRFARRSSISSLPARRSSPGCSSSPRAGAAPASIARSSASSSRSGSAASTTSSQTLAYGRPNRRDPPLRALAAGRGDDGGLREQGRSGRAPLARSARPGLAGLAASGSRAGALAEPPKATAFSRLQGSRPQDAT